MLKTQYPKKTGKASPKFDKRLRDSSGFPDVGVTLFAYKYDALSGSKQPSAERQRRPGRRFTRLAHKLRLKPKRVLMVLFVLVFLACGWLGWKFIYNGSRVFGGNIFGIFSSTRLKGEDVGRVNILLAGNSADDPGHAGANLTDSIMILSIDTKNHNAFMLSIPRDLWVDIPGYGYHKINEANVYGDAEHFSEVGYPKGGIGLLDKVIEQNFGLALNYYVLINYNAFRQAVTAVGGIDVTINSSDRRGLYDPNIAVADGGPLKLANGRQHLDGQTALNLARARGDSYYSYGFPQSDFNRTEHQRQMLIALQKKAVSSSVLANPVKLAGLSDALGNNVKTDFTLSEVHRLYDIGKNIDVSAIKSLGLNDGNGKNLLASYAAPGGMSALIPAAGIDNFTDIQLFIKRLTSHDPVVMENASVVLLNATNTYGLAAKHAKQLAAKNVNVTALGDAYDLNRTSLIIDNSKDKKPATKQLLQSLYGNKMTTNNLYADKYDADFILILGTDQIVN